MDTTATERLVLSPLSLEDLDDVLAVYGDPRTWAHLPSGRHRDRDQSAALIARGRRSWSEHGLGPWALGSSDTETASPPGTFIGSGGVTFFGPGLWNLGYRLSPAFWGRGFATEVATAALTAAREADPGAPIVARVLSNNPASSAVAQRVGLTLRWEGPTGDPVGPDVHRRIYTDRAPTEDQLAWLVDNA